MRFNFRNRLIILGSALIGALLFFSFKPMTEKPKIIYVFDPMCGWCYGFSKVINRYATEHKTEFDFDIISGGMVVGDREGPIGDFAEYILGAYKRVEDYSGVKFGEAYLAQLRTKKLWSSSVTPAIAIETFKTYKPDEAIAFASAVQKSYFYDGKDLRSDDVYREVLKPYAIDADRFIEKMHTEQLRKAATDGFQESANYGITGYPAVLLLYNGKYYMVAKGFTDYETFSRTVQTVLDKYK
jgi:putative protein-disulfide isomerase